MKFGAADVFEEDQAEGDVFVIAGLHIAAQFVGGFKKFGFEA